MCCWYNAVAEAVETSLANSSFPHYYKVLEDQLKLLLLTSCRYVCSFPAKRRVKNNNILILFETEILTGEMTDCHQQFKLQKSYAGS